ncbi:methyltransferase domain-containing protein [Pedobacter sp. PLR]|uniref:methyltransferase domain-containing protein n=1 Tax=Pedobacter sp. PLR TaxID=2994465 RepID=UPI002246CCC3|nr:methyltransferase domain-containing protein [Pedobacter sp. PLR]MCX2449929.1 methyltransferase domain-containing protein [Pedobacter sp. PLR]
MKDYLKRDIIGWDTENWSRAIPFWEKLGQLKQRDNKCLELGAYGGGLSLWLALNKNRVICSNLEIPDANTKKIHHQYNCLSYIAYEAIDATNIPYADHFDFITFKSILGGIPGVDGQQVKIKTINQIHTSLKPGGKLLFAENLSASIFHKILRYWFGTKNWNYLKLSDMDVVFSSFSDVKYTTVGFFGCFGRNESQRIFLGKLDKFFDWMIPRKCRYIIIGIATK